MPPPVPSPIDRIAFDVCAELGLDMGGGTERRIVRLIRETIMTEHIRCARVVEALNIVGDMSDPMDAIQLNLKRAAQAIRDLPIAS